MLTVNELFSGIGAQRAALNRLKIPYEIVGISEIDTYAIKSYEAMWGITYNYEDITKLKALKYADLWTYSFPCTDISIAGENKGIVKGVTRSGLLYEVQRLLEVAKVNNTLPKYLLLENVKNLVGVKYIEQFEDWLQYLEELGYNTYWSVLNSKDYGVPQNRERVFGVSICKDIDKGFQFPIGMMTEKRLKDVLESDVESKHTINPRFLSDYTNREAQRSVGDTNRVNQIGNLIKSKTRDNPSRGRVYDINYIAPTLTCSCGGNRQPYIPFMDKEGKLNYRKLTPREYWRLMGFTDEEFDKAQRVCSDNQLYKQAGNSIVVDVLYYIFKEMLQEEKSNG